MNIAALLRRAALARPDAPAIAHGTEPYADYRGFADRAARLGGWLRREVGCRPGDRLALAMRNCPAYLEVLFGCWYAGLAAVPLNAKLHPREFAYAFEHCRATAVFATSDLADTMADACSALAPSPRLVIADDAALADAFAAEPIALADTSADDLAWLFYTSGTTGRPKGAMLSHRNLLAMAHAYLADVDTIAEGDCLLHAAPMSHGSGMYIFPHVLRAALQVIPRSGKFDPAEVVALIARHPGTALFAAPTMVKRLVDSPALRGADLANLKTVVYGGGPMYVADCKHARAVLGDKLVQIYGQGESPMTITTLSRARHAETEHPRYEDRLGSAGVPYAIVEVEVRGADDRALPPGEVGEVCVRGDTVMTGYWNDSEATARTLRDGWLYTGDVGSFDADGFLTLKDRSKDLIISGGSNIYPREVEEVLLRHDAVGEVSVIGLPDPDWGEVVVAFVVAATGREVDPAALDAFCLDHIARFKRPKHYRVLEALPKNNYGKVLKTELRALAAAAG